MTAYIVTGIAAFGDPNQINQALREHSAFDGLRLTIIGSSSHGELGEAGEGGPAHTGIVEVVHGGSAYPEGAILTGRAGTGVPGFTTGLPTIAFIEHPTVFDYLRDLELPYDLAVNYNLAIAAGRNIVACEVPREKASTVEQVFHDLGLRNIHTIAPREAALVPA